LEPVVQAVLAAAGFAATFVVRFFVKRRCHASAPSADETPITRLNNLLGTHS